MHALPMGFSWAFHWLQLALEEIAPRKLPNIEFLKDRVPVHSVNEILKMLISHNGCHLQCNAVAVNADCQSFSGALISLRFHSHEIATAAKTGTTLRIWFPGTLQNLYQA